MKKHLFVSLFLLFCINTFAQTSPTLEELNFHSDFEKNAFKDIKASSQFDLIFAVNPNITKDKTNQYKKQLSNFFEVLEKKKVRKKKLKKAVKIIFEMTHENFFKKYENYAEFHQIFKDGTFNCVTASALYALTLEHFDIPYEIRELPTHVYIIVAPQGEHIVLESTDPVGGLYRVDKSQFVKSLAQMKLISEAELQRNSIDDLYEKYAESEEKSIGFRELAGDLYYNASLQSLELEFFKKTLDLIEKCLFLYDFPNAKYIKIAVQLQLAEKANIEDYKSLKYTFDLLEYEEYSTEVKNNIDVYNYKITQKYLIDEFDEAEYWKRHHYIIKHVNPEKFPDLYKKIQIIHFKQMIYSHHLRGKLDLAWNYIDSAYQIVPNDLNIQNMIVEKVLKGIKDSENPDDFVKKVDIYFEKYAFLKERTEITNILVMIASDKVINTFLENEAKGLEELASFEKELETKNADKKFKSMAIGNIYGAIHSYHLRNMDNDKAKEWLEKGLAKAPNATELLRKKKLFDDYQNGKW